jgi:anti-sigma-K factor RskA
VVVLLISLLIGAILYAYILHSRVTTESDQRRQVEAVLQEESKRVALLKKQVAEQEQQVAALKAQFTERSSDISRFKEALVSRDHELVNIHKDLVQRDQELVSLRKTFAQRSEMLGVLQSPNVKVIWLSGSHRAPSARAIVLFDPQTRKGLLYAYNLPQPPAGKTYHLWAILDKPVSAGTITIDSGNKSRLLIKGTPNWARVSKFAVSLERQGGRPKLPGDLYLGVGL